MSSVCCRLQVAILARLSREMPQTVRIDWQSILSRVRISVRPSKKNYTGKTPKNDREDRVQRKCLLNEPPGDVSKRGGNAGTAWSITSE